jgi:hypothetical protein
MADSIPAIVTLERSLRTDEENRSSPMAHRRSRRYLMEQLPIDRAARWSPLSTVMCDVDHFKKTTYGRKSATKCSNGCCQFAQDRSNSQSPVGGENSLVLPETNHQAVRCCRAPQKPSALARRASQDRKLAPHWQTAGSGRPDTDA